jgi:hypothetical protein
MTAAPPPRDSVLDALGYAFRVLSKPGFLWAPLLLYLILLLPLLPLGLLARPGPPTTFATQAELDAYLRNLIPVFVGTAVVSFVVTPLANAVMFRLAQQFVDGAAPQPFAPGIVALAWRFFLQTLVFVLLAIAAVLVLGILFLVLQAILGAALALLITGIGGFIGYLFAVLRLGLSLVLLLTGAGPIEAMRLSWERTRGQMGRMFRWLFVSGLVLGIAGGVAAALVGAVIGVLGQPILGQILGPIVAAPFGLMGSIVLVLLARLISSPNQPPPPPPLPDWMNRPAATDEPAGGPPVASA